MLDEASVVVPVDQRIKVICRVRPPVSRETNNGATAHKCVSIGEDNKTVIIAAKPTNKQFTFDYAAGELSTQEEIFLEVGKPVTLEVLEGYNGTIFCYGQTGSGKTFTTFGPSATAASIDDDPVSVAQRAVDAGLVPRVLEFLFGSIGEKVAAAEGKLRYKCRCSFYEIFNERVFDLLDTGGASGVNGLNVREDTRKGVYVENLTEENVVGADAAGMILRRGYRNRHVGETNMNRESSRSHAVFTLVIEATEDCAGGVTRSRTARFNLVDLAGSERQKSTEAGGDRLKEASSINGSLSALGQVISALVEKAAGRDRHVPYRNSRLTFLLRDSLGGNSKTMLVAAVSPADVNFAETLSTLKFAQRAKMIKNMAVRNEDTSGSFEALKAEVASLRQQLLLAGAGNGSFCVTSELGLGGFNSDMPCDPSDKLSILVGALRRTVAAETACEEAYRKAAIMQELADKAEKATMQKEMILKFRDSAIAAQRKKDGDAEKTVMAEEIAFLQNELQTSKDGDSVEVCKLRLAYSEALSRLAELTGEPQVMGSKAQWSQDDRVKFTSELDAQVLSLAEEVTELRSEVIACQTRLEEALENAAVVAENAANSKVLEQKQMMEDALLRKLQESHRLQEDAQSALATSESRLAAVESSRTELLHKVSSIAKQLDEERKRYKALEQGHEEHVSALRTENAELAAQKELAEDRTGSAVSDLQRKLATAYKDNSLLLQRARKTAEEADEIEDELEKARVEIAQGLAKLEKEQTEASEKYAALEAQLKLQEDVHERETEEWMMQKQSMDSDFDELQAKQVQQEENHRLMMEEARKTQEDITENLATARSANQELEARVASLRDEYDTLSEEVAFSTGRVAELEDELERTLQTHAAQLGAMEEELVLAKETGRVLTETLASVESSLESALQSSAAAAQTYANERNALELQILKAVSDGIVDLAIAQALGDEAIEKLTHKLDTTVREASEREAVLVATFEHEKLLLCDKIAALEGEKADVLACLEQLKVVSAAREKELCDSLCEANMCAEQVSIEHAAVVQGLNDNAREARDLYEKTISALKDENVCKLEKLERASALALEEMNTTHAHTLKKFADELAAKIDEYELAIHSLKKEHSNEIESLTKASAEALEEAKSAHASIVEKLNNEAKLALEEYESTLENLKNEHSTEIDAVKTESMLALDHAECVHKEALDTAVQDGLEKARADVAELTEKHRVMLEEIRNAAVLHDAKCSEELSAEKHQVEVLTIAQELLVAENAATVQGLNERIDSLMQEVKVMTEELTDAGAKHRELVLSLEKATMEFATAQEKISALEVDLDSACTEKAALTSQIATLEESQQATLLQVEGLEAHLSEMNISLSEKCAELVGVEHKLTAQKAKNTKEAKKATAAAEKLSEELEAVTSQLDARTHQLDAANQAWKAASEEVEELKSHAKEVENRLSALEIESSAAKEESATALEKMEESMSELQSTLKEQKSELRAKTKEVKSLKLEVEQKEKEGNSLKDAMADLESQLEGAKTEITASKAESEKLSATLAAELEKEREEKEALQAEIDKQKDEIHVLTKGQFSPEARKEMEDHMSTLQADNRGLLKELSDEKQAREAADSNLTQLMVKLEELQESNASLVGHKNSKQKIQQHQKLKTENIELQRLNKLLDAKVLQLKKQLEHVDQHTTHASASSVSNSTALSAASSAASMSSAHADASHDDNSNVDHAKKYNLRSLRAVGADVTNHV